MTNSVYFVNSEQALYWLMEQKRQRNNISTSNLETLDETEIKPRDLTVSELLKWSGVYKFPQGKEESALVSKVLDKAFLKLEKRTQVILVLLYLGDFATPDMYAKAKNTQKILKQRGYRTVLSYKYQKVKVAKMLNIDRKTVTRHVQKANLVLTKDLLKAGFILDKENTEI